MIAIILSIVVFPTILVVFRCRKNANKVENVRLALTFAIACYSFSSALSYVLDYDRQSLIITVLVFLLLFLLDSKFSQKTALYKWSPKIIFLIIIFFASVLIKMTLVWGCKTFPLYDVRNVYIALQLPLDGFAALFVIDWLKNILTKSTLCLLAFTPLWFTYFAKQKHSYSIIVTICFGIFAWGLISFSMDVPLKEYYRVFTNTEEEKKFLETSAFWDSNFVDIDTDSISSFDKRNLILIFMESMENTFSDSSSGGIQTSNLIPYLTNLANNNISFSNTSLLGGGRNIYGSTNTLKSSICKITGLPVINEAIRRTVVFPNVVVSFPIIRTVHN